MGIEKESLGLQDSKQPTKVLSFLRRSLIRGHPLLQPQSYAVVSFLRCPLLQPQSLGNKTPHHTVSPNATKKRESYKESHIKDTDAFPFGTVTSSVMHLFSVLAWCMLNNRKKQLTIGDYGDVITVEIRRRVQILADSSVDLLAFETVPNKLEAEVTTKPIVIYPNSGETYDADLKEWVQTEVQKLLKQLADERFSEASNHSSNVNLVDKSRKVLRRLINVQKAKSRESKEDPLELRYPVTKDTLVTEKIRNTLNGKEKLFSGFDQNRFLVLQTQPHSPNENGVEPMATLHCNLEDQYSKFCFVSDMQKMSGMTKLKTKQETG
ncbi:hypothetical protein JHK85_004999 [Glycine max]|nr:hypothetical protein JHK85_004999 [Glycine max]